MSTSTFHEAVLAASTRARDCRERLDELRAGAGYSAANVEHARERLAAAQRRADLAFYRAATQVDVVAHRERRAELGVTRRSWADRPAPTQPDLISVPIDPTVFPERLGRLGCSATEVWTSYAALCGRRSLLEVDAALHGALVLPDIDNLRLDQALWEREQAF